jgi:hypothetical protein
MVIFIYWQDQNPSHFKMSKHLDNNGIYGNRPIAGTGATTQPILFASFEVVHTDG